MSDKVISKVRLRNLTTRKLHTNIKHVYEDIEFLTGQKGLMTHNIPSALRAIEPYLRRCVDEKRFWDGEYDPHVPGTIKITSMDRNDLTEFWDIYIQ